MLQVVEYIQFLEEKKIACVRVVVATWMQRKSNLAAKVSRIIKPKQIQAVFVICYKAIKNASRRNVKGSLRNLYIYLFFTCL
ncbi:uncharacterized protein [Triticum aestivum]|uniref:uncharacterized protein isoform X2 n=1 Tax=Triticum aestivum TaxID=4565 RepID=UPI001D00CD8D|nr:uncharacterized protein LOC123075748 isoform X2 [Triticum aestivum]